MRFLVTLLLVAVAAVPAVAQVEVQVGPGLVRMDYVNDQLAALAARQDADYTPLRTVWQLGASYWAWPMLGVKAEGLWGSGAVEAREVERTSTLAVGISARGRYTLDILGAGLVFHGGIGGYWARADGIVAGTGWAVGGQAGADWKALNVGPFGVAVGIGARYLPVLWFRHGGGGAARQDNAALDFSGLFISVSVSLP